MNRNTNPKSDPKFGAIHRLHEAYGRGDVDAVLAELADDIDWAAEAVVSTSVPWYGSYHGKADMPRFFSEIGSRVEVTEFTPLSFMSNDTTWWPPSSGRTRVNATGKCAAIYGNRRRIQEQLTTSTREGFAEATATVMGTRRDR